MTIELTDVKSGEKDVIEEENMVTNALANIFAPLGHLMNTDTIYNQYNSYYAKLLGACFFLIIISKKMQTSYSLLQMQIWWDVLYIHTE